jgi:hypothetical protein
MLAFPVQPNLFTEISTSRERSFPLVDFIDTPGLVDGDMTYPFDVQVCSAEGGRGAQRWQPPQTAGQSGTGCWGLCGAGCVPAAHLAAPDCAWLKLGGPRGHGR